MKTKLDRPEVLTILQASNSSGIVGSNNKREWKFPSPTWPNKGAEFKKIYITINCDEAAKAEIMKDSKKYAKSQSRLTIKSCTWH